MSFGQEQVFERDNQIYFRRALGEKRIVEAEELSPLVPRITTAQLRNLNANSVKAESYILTDDGKEGTYWRKRGVGLANEDNRGTILVTSDLIVYEMQFKGAVNAKWFGAVGNFNPADNSGTDDTNAFQAALDNLKNGGALFIPEGNYKISGTTKLGGTSIAIEDTTNLTLTGYKATLYQGATSGRLLGIFNSSFININLLKLVGNTISAGNVASERYCAINVNYNSHNIVIDGNYITNFLGDCIYCGGSLVDGSLTGYTTQKIVIKNNTLKERYGNGTRSYSGGSQSRLAIALIDCKNVLIHDNIIYGRVDLEPNGDGQFLVGLRTYNNNFRSGFVTPQSVIATAYNFDEPLGNEGDVGVVEIPQGCIMTGHSAAPIVSNCAFESNTFENGIISIGNIYAGDIIRNRFKKGQIQVGSTSGSNSTINVLVQNNSTLAPLAGETSFIKLTGNVAYSDFSNNKCDIAGGYCIHNHGIANTGDLGRNYFSNNSNRSTTAAGSIGFTPVSTSISLNSWYNAATADERARSERVLIREIRQDLIVVALTASNQVIDYRTTGGNIWYLSGLNFSLARVSNIPDGTRLTILSGGTSGQPTKIIYNSSYIRTADGLDVTLLSSNQVITFVVRAGILFEESRNFNRGTVTTVAYNPPSLVTGAQTTTTVTVAGALLGDFVQVTFGADLQGLTLTAYVSSANAVTVVLSNLTGGTVDLVADNLNIGLRTRIA